MPCVGADASLWVSDDLPRDGEQRLQLGTLLHSAFQGPDELIPLLDDLIFHIEDTLPLSALLALKVSERHLGLELLLRGLCLSRAPVLRLDLCLRVREFLLGKSRAASLLEPIEVTANQQLPFVKVMCGLHWDTAYTEAVSVSQ